MSDTTLISLRSAPIPLRRRTTGKSAPFKRLEGTFGGKFLRLNIAEDWACVLESPAGDRLVLWVQVSSDGGEVGYLPYPGLQLPHWNLGWEEDEVLGMARAIQLQIHAPAGTTLTIVPAEDVAEFSSTVPLSENLPEKYGSQDDDNWWPGKEETLEEKYPVLKGKLEAFEARQAQEEADRHVAGWMMVNLGMLAAMSDQLPEDNSSENSP